MAISNLGNISSQYISDPLSRGTLGLSSPLTSGYNPMAKVPAKLPKINIPTSTGGGGFFGKMGSMFGANKLSSAQGAGISMAGSVINKLGNSLISDGMSTGAGNAVADIGGTVGGIVGNFNPVLGGIISAGTGIIGGVINRGFGYSIANEGAMKSNTARLGGISVGDDFASMASATSNAGLQGTGRVRNGWFNHKGDRIASDLMRDQFAAQAGLLSKVNNAGMNIDRTTDNLAQASYAALGGFLGNPFNPNNTGALGIMQQDAYVDTINNRSNAMYGRRNNGVYAFGGELGTNGTDFTNGLLQINAGGLHETNPYQGVQMGVDAQGTPNLVEQGETVFNDYVFSNRMKVPEALHRHFGLGGRLKDGITFADASKKIAKESEERPNDPISIAGLNETLARLAEVQEAERQREQAEEVINGYALGGPKSSPTSKLGALRRMRENQDEIRGLKAGQESYALTPNNTGESIPWDAGVRDRMRYFQDNIGRLKDESAAVTPTPGVFGGGDFGGGSGGYFNLYPNYSDRTTFNEAFDAAYEDALSQGLRPEDYIFMYGEKPYTAEKTKNPLREVDNRLVGNSNKRSKLKKTDNYQHMTMGIPGSGIQFAQGGLMGNLYDGTGKHPNYIKKRNPYYLAGYPDSANTYVNYFYSPRYLHSQGQRWGNTPYTYIDLNTGLPDYVPPEATVSNSNLQDYYYRDWTRRGVKRVRELKEENEKIRGPFDPNRKQSENKSAVKQTTQTPVENNPTEVFADNANYNLSTRVDPNNPVLRRNYDAVYGQDIPIGRGMNGFGYINMDYSYAPGNTGTTYGPTKEELNRLATNQVLGYDPDSKVDYREWANTLTPQSGASTGRTTSTNRWGVDTDVLSKYNFPINSVTPDKAPAVYSATDANPVQSTPVGNTPSRASGTRTPARGNRPASKTPADTTNPMDVRWEKGRMYENPNGNLIGLTMRSLANQKPALPEAEKRIEPDIPKRIDTPEQPYVGTYEQQDELPTWMRYIPALGGAIGVATDALGWTNKPDYTYADKIEAAADSAGYTPDVQYTPIGNYMRYNPMDITYGLNQLAAQSRATDRELQNVAGTRGAAMSGLLANGYNNQLAEGNMYRQALEYNDALRKQAEEFNRATDQYNSQMGLEAAVANARYQQIARNARLSGLAQAAAMRDAIDQRVSAARSANLTNLFNSLGNIGKENFIFNQINASSPANNNYGISTTGTTTHRGNKMLGSSKSKKSNKKGGQ